MVKQGILELLIAGDITRKKAAETLKMHPNAVSRLKKRYQEHGFVALMPAKPGPKKGHKVHNRTAVEVEDIVVALGVKHAYKGPAGLADDLKELCDITLDQSTIWRILKRRGVRYTKQYKRWKQDYTPYALDKPGKELQLDGSYPFGRERDLVAFSAIDDCSRYVYVRLYEHEDADSAIDFVTQLVKRAPFHITRLRVDNRYGKRFKTFCSTLGIHVITNPPYCPQKNGKVERFHKTLKREFFWKQPFHLPQETLAYRLNLWLGHYNYQRRHGGYKMNRMTPAQKIAATYHQLLTRSYAHDVTGTLQQYKT